MEDIIIPSIWFILTLTMCEFRVRHIPASEVSYTLYVLSFIFIGTITAVLLSLLWYITGDIWNSLI